MDACTVTTLDVITAFAVPNLNCPSQDQSIFSGLATSRVSPVCPSPSLLRTGNDLFLPTLSTVDGCNLNTSVCIVNAHILCKGRVSHRKINSI